MNNPSSPLPFVSVVVPTYNRWAQLRDCMKSLIRQTYPSERYEIIVVDDGSKDRTKQTVQEFKSIKYIYQDNKGPSAARNAGIKIAKGEIIAFIDDDCTANKSWIENFARVFGKNPGYQVIQGPYHYTSRGNPLHKTTKMTKEHADKLRVIPSSNFSEGKEALYVGPGSLAIRKNAILQYDLFFDENLVTREDEDLFRRIDKLGLKVGFMENPVLHICQFDFLSDMKRYFNYGRGEYHLRKKWGDYTRLEYKLCQENLFKHYGIMNALSVRIALKLRHLFYQNGLWHESKQF